MHFCFDPLARAFSNRCDSDENSQRISVNRRPKHIEMYAFSNEDAEYSFHWHYLTFSWSFLFKFPNSFSYLYAKCDLALTVAVIVLRQALLSTPKTWLITDTHEYCLVNIAIYVKNTLCRATVTTVQDTWEEKRGNDFFKKMFLPLQEYKTLSIFLKSCSSVKVEMK